MSSCPSKNVCQLSLYIYIYIMYNHEQLNTIKCVHGLPSGCAGIRLLLLLTELPTTTVH